MENGEKLITCSTDEALHYIVFLARHVPAGDISSVILIVLMELSFQPHLDGFIYLRDSIERKTENQRKRVNAILLELVAFYHSVVDYANIEQSIRHCISSAWKRRNEVKWIKYLTSDFYAEGKPSNAAFISQVACMTELWRNCQQAK